MQIAVVSFTENGNRIAEKLVVGLGEQGHDISRFVKSKYGDEKEEGSLIEEPLSEWTRSRFDEGLNLIFIGAVGIAVRMVGPCLQGKDRDPAVVVIDEQGTFCIPVLSGHLGGANDLAREAATLLDAIPVITTATDLNHKFAVDLFAKKNKLHIANLSLAKEISAAVLREEKIDFSGDYPIEGERPDCLGTFSDAGCRIRITIEQLEEDRKTLYLVPRAIVLGIGCRKGTDSETIGAAVTGFLSENRIRREAIAAVASIDLKKEEPGLKAFAQEERLPFITYSKEALEAIEGQFTESEFVRSVTGISNVCERAALCGCEGEGYLLVKKTVYSGVTVAAAFQSMKLRF